jgi:DNA mismatch repair protein MutL
MNAVKELIENSLDAGANRIAVHVQVPAASSSAETSAGLFSIQVIDNGSGISKEDLDLLCERHATSKLVSVGDLRSVGTFGFRGEALASCSQVARVEVVTRSREDGEEVAWKATYVLGRMTGEPTPLAGNFGTIINVKDLFYGNRVRREALLQSSEEFQKIFQLIQAYALSQAGKCAFNLSKRRDRMEIQTVLTDGVVAVVKNLWGEELGGALLPFNIEVDMKLGIEEGSGGWATRTTFHKLKSPQVIIFLNGRLIEHAALRRSMLQAFAMHLPTSPPAHPFIYLCLRVKGSRVDVNVHPSKKQVYFLDEGEIMGKAVEAIEEGVLRKQYETQTLKPIIIENIVEKRAKTENSCYPVTKSKAASAPKISSLYPSQRVLTDSSNHRIDTFLYHSQASKSSTGDVGNGGWSNLGRVKVSGSGAKVEEKMNVLSPLMNSGIVSNAREPCTLVNLQEPLMSSSPLEVNPTIRSNSVSSVTENITKGFEVNLSESHCSSCNAQTCSVNHQSPSSPSSGPSVDIQSQSSPLTPILSSFPPLLSKSNDQLSKLLKESLVVGLIDSKWCLLQSGTNLLLCDMDRLNYELFYSLIGQKVFSGDGRVFVLEGLGLRVKGVFDVEVGVEGDEEDIGREAEEVLRGQVKFLKEEFGIQFDEEEGGDLMLKGMPVIITGQRCPSLRHLSTFIQRLCLVPNYENPETKACQVSEELAMVYGLVDVEEWEDWEEYVKHVVLPAYRDQRAKYSLRDEFRYESKGNLAVVPPLQIITNTETLYKSFERC